MRKLILTIGIVASFVVAASSVAQAASHHPRSHHPRESALCNPKYPGGRANYSPACTTPKLTFNMPSPACVKSGPGYKLPNLTFVSNAGIREIEILVDGKTVKLTTFAGAGKSQYRLNGFHVPTTGLASGAHTVTIEVKDVLGRSVRKALHFSVCAAKPVFTG